MKSSTKPLSAEEVPGFWGLKASLTGKSQQAINNWRVNELIVHENAHDRSGLGLGGQEWELGNAKEDSQSNLACHKRERE